MTARPTSHAPLAIVREVSRSIDRCELTHVERRPIDLERARVEHRALVDLLASLGALIEVLPEEPDLPDAVFVEDAAIVLDEVAIITRPGAAGRRGELESIETALAPHRPLARIAAPATLDGGDVLRCGRRLCVGCSSRTSRAGIEQLDAIAAPRGYEVRPVAVDGCLHLKSAATEVADGVLLVNPSWIDRRIFDGLELIEVDPREPDGANALRVGGSIIHPARMPRTAERLRQRGLDVRSIAAGELAKAEGGMTCCCLLVP
jgi:dimethylargininase